MALRRNVALQLSHSYKQITVLLITYAELTNRRLGRVKPAPRVTNFDIRVSHSLVNRVVTPKCCRQLIGLYLPESLFPNPPNPFFFSYLIYDFFFLCVCVLFVCFFLFLIFFFSLFYFSDFFFHVRLGFCVCFCCGGSNFTC